MINEDAWYAMGSEVYALKLIVGNLAAHVVRSAADPQTLLKDLHGQISQDIAEQNFFDSNEGETEIVRERMQERFDGLWATVRSRVPRQD